MYLIVSAPLNGTVLTFSLKQLTSEAVPCFQVAIAKRPDNVWNKLFYYKSDECNGIISLSRINNSIYFLVEKINDSIAKTAYQLSVYQLYIKLFMASKH